MTVGYLSTQPNAVVLADMVEAESGRNDDRPILRQAVELCRKESAILLVSKIDRLSRSLRLIMMLEHYRVPFVAADNPEMTELVCHILVAIGQAERKTSNGFPTRSKRRVSTLRNRSQAAI